MKKPARFLVLLVLSIHPVSAAQECRPIDGIEPLLQPGRVLLLGELHGTGESPAFALDVACHAVAADLAVRVGLERSETERASVDRFLASAGTDDDRRRLIAAGFWQSDYQDGRASRAMLDLLDGVRRLRRAGADVAVVLFDASGRGGNQSRDRAMGLKLARAFGEAPDAMTIVLTGNVHSRIVPGSSRNSEFEPMGYVLAQRIGAEKVLALNVAHGGGSAWLCNPKCAAQVLSGSRGDSVWSIEIDDATRPAGHHGWYHVGTITASPPARLPSSSVVLPTVPSDQSDRSSTPASELVQPQRADESASTPRPLSQVESKFQGRWQAYDFGSNSKTYTMSFDGRRFRAQGGPDEWYVGRVEIRPDRDPSHIDFAIEDCRCSYKGEKSQGIFHWDGDSIVMAAPRPGSRRPGRFAENSGQMMRLIRLQQD